MSKPNGWLNDWEAEADERRALAPSPAAPEPPEPVTFVYNDEPSCDYCSECSTFYTDDGDGCPTCGAGAS